MASDLIQFDLVEPDGELYADIVRRFEGFNRSHTDWGAQAFSMAYSTGGRVVAAARGVVNMGLVEIRGVWINPDLRGQGLGRELMRAVEAEAHRRGCAKAALDTYSWQAVGFYLRLGYVEFGVLDYPNGQRRHYLTKDLR